MCCEWWSWKTTAPHWSQMVFRCFGNIMQLQIHQGLTMALRSIWHRATQASVGFLRGASAVRVGLSHPYLAQRHRKLRPIWADYGTIPIWPTRNTITSRWDGRPFNKCQRSKQNYKLTESKAHIKQLSNEYWYDNFSGDCVSSVVCSACRDSNWQAVSSNIDTCSIAYTSSSSFNKSPVQ